MVLQREAALEDVKNFSEIFSVAKLQRRRFKRDYAAYSRGDPG